MRLRGPVGESLISLSVQSCSAFCSLCLGCVVHKDAGLLLPPLPPVPPEQDGQQEEQQEAQSSPNEPCFERQTVVPGLVHHTGPFLSSIIHCNHTNLCNVIYVVHSAAPLVLPEPLPLLPPYCHNISWDIWIRCTPSNYNLRPIPGHWFQAGSVWNHII